MVGRNNRAGKKGKSNKSKGTYEDAKENGLYSIQIAMATQLTAFVDVTGCGLETMEEVMELTIQYNNNLMKHSNHIKEVTDQLHDSCGINISIDPRDLKIVMPQQWDYLMRKYEKLLEEHAKLVTKHNKTMSILKGFVKGVYSQEIKQEAMDNYVCERCCHKDKNGECPLDFDKDNICKQTDEEATELLMKWLLEHEEGDEECQEE